MDGGGDGGDGDNGNMLAEMACVGADDGCPFAKFLAMIRGDALDIPGKSSSKEALLEMGQRYSAAQPFGEADEALCLCGIAELYAYYLSDGDGPVDELMTSFADNLRGLTQFVLGLFVSLVLAKTYYANRGCFGTVFGCTMGFAQMTTAWVRAPPGVPADEGRVTMQESRHLLVRWANAAFRLMVLEARDLTPGEIGDQLVARELLTTAEWKHIAGLKSRATHVYQWMNNVLHDLLDAGYIRDPVFVNRMHTQIDDMRGANVWGLPSLPIMYTLLITVMVKMYLFLLACKYGATLKNVHQEIEEGGDGRACWDVRSHLEMALAVFLQNLLFQGLLDLHQVLYSPNQGTEVSHMPSDNFLNFVEQVTTDLVEKNEVLPYKTSIPIASARKSFCG